MLGEMKEITAQTCVKEKSHFFFKMHVEPFLLNVNNVAILSLYSVQMLCQRLAIRCRHSQMYQMVDVLNHFTTND